MASSKLSYAFGNFPPLLIIKAKSLITFMAILYMSSFSGAKGIPSLINMPEAVASYACLSKVIIVLNLACFCIWKKFAEDLHPQNLF